MEILLGGLIVLVLVLGFAILRLQRQNHIPTAEAPSIDSAGVADELSRTVRAELAQAMNTLADRSTKDREEALKLGADLIARAGGEQLGKRADIIDTSMQRLAMVHIAWPNQVSGCSQKLWHLNWPIVIFESMRLRLASSKRQ